MTRKSPGAGPTGPDGTGPAAGVLPPAADKARTVQQMFGAIAPRYDLLNHLLSLNRDRAWRRHAIDRLLEDRTTDGTYLDACAGTLDLSLELAGRPGFAGRVVACDFVLGMLERGTSKIAGRPITPVCGDVLRLPLADASVEGAVVGFGVRNLASLDDGFAELARVLRPGGRLVVLEFTTPGWQPFRALYLYYFRRVLPLLGHLVSRHGTAYSYLPESVLAFPEPAELGERIAAAGFTGVRWETRTGGIVAVHVGERTATGGAAVQETATAS